jgi:SPP1 family predicted phage head-tail adaptor
VKAGRVRAGAFRQSLILQRRVTSTDAEGSPQEGWVSIGLPIRARVEPLGGREFAMAGQLEMKLSHTVKTYYRQDLAQTSSAVSTSGHNMRLLWNGRVLDIQLVEDPDGRQRVLELLCLEFQD